MQQATATPTTPPARYADKETQDAMHEGLCAVTAAFGNIEGIREILFPFFNDADEADKPVLRAADRLLEAVRDDLRDVANSLDRAGLDCFSDLNAFPLPPPVPDAAAPKRGTALLATPAELRPASLAPMDRSAFALAFHEESQAAQPEESLVDVVGRAMVRVRRMIAEREAC